MKKTVLLLVLSLSLLVSCKDEKSNEAPKKEESKSVKVVLNAIVKTDDDFQLFFKEEDNISNPFEETNAVWTKVKGSETPQNIEFLLPENVLPNYLRLDVGINDKQQGVSIKGLTIEYLDKKFEMNNTNFFDNYFINNNSIEIKDKTTGDLVTKKGDGSLYDPVFNSGENLKFELQKLFK